MRNWQLCQRINFWYALLEVLPLGYQRESALAGDEFLWITKHTRNYSTDVRGTLMSTAKASGLKQAKQLLDSGSVRRVELEFELDSDSFFAFASEYCSDGARLTRKDNHFVITKQKTEVPSNDHC